MMGLGAPELLIILVIVLVVFGAGKLPQVLGSLGKGVKEFRDASESGTTTTATTTTTTTPTPASVITNTPPAEPAGHSVAPATSVTTVEQQHTTKTPG